LPVAAKPAFILTLVSLGHDARWEFHYREKIVLSLAQQYIQGRSIGSGGTLAAVGVPVSAGGLALATAGTAVAAKSATSFMVDASHSSQISSDKVEINLCSGKNKVATGTDYETYRKKGAPYPNHRRQMIDENHKKLKRKW